MFSNVNVKFCNSGTCVSTCKWDSRIYVHDILNITTMVVLQVIFFGRIHGFKLLCQYVQVWIYISKWAHQCQKIR